MRRSTLLLMLAVVFLPWFFSFFWIHQVKTTFDSQIRTLKKNANIDNDRARRFALEVQDNMELMKKSFGENLNTLEKKIQGLENQLALLKEKHAKDEGKKVIQSIQRKKVYVGILLTPQHPENTENPVAIDTVRALLARYPFNRNMIRILIANTETNEAQFEIIENMLKKELSLEIEQGVVELMSVPYSRYSILLDPCTLDKKYDASMLSVVKNSKRVLDELFVMMKMSEHDDFWYILLGETTVPRTNLAWIEELLDWITQRELDKRDDWMFVDLTQSGVDMAELDLMKMQQSMRGAEGPMALLLNPKTMDSFIQYFGNNFDTYPLHRLFAEFQKEHSLKAFGFQSPPMFDMMTRVPSNYGVEVTDFQRVLEDYSGPVSWAECTQDSAKS